MDVSRANTKYRSHSWPRPNNANLISMLRLHTAIRSDDTECNSAEMILPLLALETTIVGNNGPRTIRRGMLVVSGIMILLITFCQLVGTFNPTLPGKLAFVPSTDAVFSGLPIADRTFLQVRKGFNMDKENRMPMVRPFAMQRRLQSEGTGLMALTH